MKNYARILGIVALMAIMGFSFIACEEAGGGGVAETSFEGSWYNSYWSETFTFNVAEGTNGGTMKKINDGGWGERGTFTYTDTTFTWTIQEITDDSESSWKTFTPNPPNDPDNSGVHEKTYKFGIKKLQIGDWTYTKK